LNRNEIEGNWKQLKGEVQKRWGKLTDDELEEMAGQREELVGRIQERYGKTREEADSEVSQFFDNLS